MFSFKSFLLKIQKNLLLILLIGSFLVNCVLGYFYFKKQENQVSSFPKIKVATALPTVQNLLEGYVKAHLKQYNIDLEVVYLPNKYLQTDELLANGEVDAKLDAHVHHLNTFNNSHKPQEDNKLTFIQPVYLAKFSLFAKQKGNIKTVEDLKNLKNDRKKLKILMIKDNFQQTLSLLLLEQLGIIKKKTQIPSDDIFALKRGDFKSCDGFPEIEYETAELLQLKNKFQNDNYDLCLQYPTIMGASNDFLSIGSITPPKELNNTIYSYTISLVARKNNEDSLKIKILQEFLKQEEIIKQAQKKPNGPFTNLENYYMIPKKDIDPLSVIIKNNYLGKTFSQETL
ncbi:Putative D-methionine transport system substrate-binding protein [Candidatus Phytoplasma australiense]|uniref:ABC-Type Methionine Transport System Periplasmic Component n=2 Tax=Phytoplasma australiense TaxID=59748 RepID=R4S071_PHYAS|nr:MetQ/NlpA family ABC transporter substrate-binding protein [Candidatus Phytoplasma australiense]AGL90199.1 ABC-Type Methionine Transport System Periplasmic Component [Strawberry lethal yellows phytoplasma (CPA) str. NZSb11]CAM11825.1 Putative D-methionine transport system substrate-binding protein [Candidatus Phytoplasma australiense]